MPTQSLADVLSAAQAALDDATVLDLAPPPALFSDEISGKCYLGSVSKTGLETIA